MNHPPPPRPAQPTELDAALMLFFHDLPAPERQARARHLRGLLVAGSPDPAGLWVVSSGSGELVGVILAEHSPGAGSLVWPPQTTPGPHRVAVEDALVQGVCGWLCRGGAKLAQSFLLPEDLARAEPLTRNGFAHVSAVWEMRLDRGEAPLLPSPPLRGRGVGGEGVSASQPPHPHPLSPEAGARGERQVSLALSPYADCDPALFRDTLLVTYEGTRDCPELNGVRTPDEVMAGYLADAPERRHWWLALADGRPVGVLLLADGADPGTWDVAYVGVVPAARGRGVGRALMLRAIGEAGSAKRGKLGLVVDARNAPAIRLYTSLGFKPCGVREVFLAVWSG